MDPRAAASSMILLVVLMLSAEAGSGSGTSTEDPEPPSVPVPTSVLITSYNLNPSLCWKYPKMSQTPIFSVQVKNYDRDEWIDSCTNIYDHCCNIYEQIKYPDESVWARVKARVGQKESAYALSEEFIICKQGKVGPPGLSIKREKDHLVVHIFHPEVIINRETLGVMFGDDSACHTFYYTVYLKSNISEKTLHTEHKVKIEDCNETLCQLSIPVSTLDSRYCVSVDGIADYWEVKTETSEDVCIPPFHNNRKDSVWILVVAPFIFFIIVILAFVCWHLKKNPFKKKSIMLPKSLLSVVRNATSETKPDSKYTSLLIPYQPAVLETETVICEEPPLCAMTAPEDRQTEDRQTTTGGPAAPGLVSLDHGSGSGSVTPCHQSRTGSDSGLVGSGGSVSGSGLLPGADPEAETGAQDPAPVRTAPTSFGYDKPHVLVAVPVDDGGKESLIGYRLTADADGLS